jgi:hypothetical protein
MLQPAGRLPLVDGLATSFVCLSIVFLGAQGRRRSPLFLLALMALISTAPGCGGSGGGGGGSSTQTPPPKPATLTGTYGITVNASSRSVTRIASFTLFVQ